MTADATPIDVLEVTEQQLDNWWARCGTGMAGLGLREQRALLLDARTARRLIARLRAVDQSGSVTRVDPSRPAAGGDPSRVVVELPAEAVKAAAEAEYEHQRDIEEREWERGRWDRLDLDHRQRYLVPAHRQLTAALPFIVAAVRAEERQATRTRVAAQIEEAYSVEGALESDDCTYAIEVARGDHGDWEPGTLAARSEASPQTGGAALITAERRRQIDVEGWTPEHDDQHGGDALKDAADCYRRGDSRGWPWAAEWWKPKGRARDLIRAGALYLAAIESYERTGTTNWASPRTNVSFVVGECRRHVTAITADIDSWIALLGSPCPAARSGASR